MILKLPGRKINNKNKVKQDISYAIEELKRLESLYNEVIHDDLIDAYSYRINGIKTHLNYLYKNNRTNI